MASSKEYIQFACDQVLAFGAVRAQLMFGDYMIYLNERPIILICDDVPFVKKLPELAPYLADAPCGIPYDGARERYILDIENRELLEQVVPILERLTPIPTRKPRKRAAKTP